MKICDPTRDSGSRVMTEKERTIGLVFVSELNYLDQVDDQELRERKKESKQDGFRVSKY